MWRKWGNYVPIVSRQWQGVEAGPLPRPRPRAPKAKEALRPAVEATVTQIALPVYGLRG